MKFTIAKEIDLELLNAQIRKYYMLNNNGNTPYLFMNQETMSRIAEEWYKQCENNENIKRHDYERIILYSADTHDTSAYVYLDNGKAFGEVEIR